MKKRLIFSYRMRRSVNKNGDVTPNKRDVGVRCDNVKLVVNTPVKSLMQDQEIYSKAYSDVMASKSRYISSNNEMNCAYLKNIFGDKLQILGNIKFPESILSETYSREVVINPNKTKKVRRTSAKLVKKHTAKENFKKAAIAVNNCPDISPEHKQLLNDFFNLYDVSINSNKKIPCAEWCHIIAVSLSKDSKSAMSNDNLFAAVAMVNSKMINLENSALLLSKKYPKVKIEINYNLFKNTETIAQLSQKLTVIDHNQKIHIFTQDISPFQIDSPSQVQSINDPKHVFNFIDEHIKLFNNSFGNKNKTLRFSEDDLSNDIQPRCIKFSHEL